MGPPELPARAYPGGSEAVKGQGTGAAVRICLEAHAESKLYDAACLKIPALQGHFGVISEAPWTGVSMSGLCLSESFPFSPAHFSADIPGHTKLHIVNI